MTRNEIDQYVKRDAAHRARRERSTARQLKPSVLRRQRQTEEGVAA